MSDRFAEVTRRAALRLWPHDAGKTEITDFIHVGQLGPVLQGLGDDLSIRKVKNIPPHGLYETQSVTLNWLFEKRIHGRIYFARLFEAGIVDHLVVIDSRQEPHIIYDSCNSYPPILSSSSLFQCGRPDANKMKSTQLYKVVRNRRSWEKPKSLK